MNCTTPSNTTTACIPCVHPFEYILEQVYVSTLGVNNRTSFAQALSIVIDKGLNQPNCGLCCPDCGGVYALASVETFLKFAEAMGYTESAAVPPALPGPLGAVDPLNIPTCCGNVYASTETFLKYAEAVGITQSGAVEALPLSANAEINAPDYLVSCCNGFDECIEELTCFLSNNSKNVAASLDRIKDKGVVEFAQIENNCTGAASSSICKLVDIFEKYKNARTLRSSFDEIFDIILDKGIVISCDSNGEIHIASVETWLKYGEAVGLTQSAAVPALGETTTTTTITV